MFLESLFAENSFLFGHYLSELRLGQLKSSYCFVRKLLYRTRWGNLRFTKQEPRTNREENKWQEIGKAAGDPVRRI